MRVYHSGPPLPIGNCREQDNSITSMLSCSETIPVNKCQNRRMDILLKLVLNVIKFHPFQVFLDQGLQVIGGGKHFFRRGMVIENEYDI